MLAFLVSKGFESYGNGKGFSRRWYSLNENFIIFHVERWHAYNAEKLF